MKESFSGCLKNVVPFLLYGVVLLVARDRRLDPARSSAGWCSRR